ncbi:MAG: secondary thiamine-phosphate synthase enzyme YjbQ [Elusimicrobiota bacterium]|jgi:secondary thiamine-phosphate synthase enzyme
MKIVTERLTFETTGSGQFIDLTEDLKGLLSSSKLKEGSMTVFGVGSTLGITTFEFEPGLARDMGEFYEKLAPSGRPYSHDKAWGDANGFSHVRSAIQGQSLTVPFESGKLCLGTWQQVVLAEFDTRPRSREVVVQMTGV